MPVIAEPDLPLTLMLKVWALSRDWKIKIPAYVPLLGALRLKVPVLLQLMLP